MLKVLCVLLAIHGQHLPGVTPERKITASLGEHSDAVGPHLIIVGDRISKCSVIAVKEGPGDDPDDD